MPDGVVVPGPDVVPVPAAPMPPLLVLLPLVLLRVLLVPVVEVELGLVAELPEVLLPLDMRPEVQPAASTAARARLSSVAGRTIEVDAMSIPCLK